LFLENQDINQVLGLASLDPFPDDFDLLGVSLASLFSLVVIGVSIVYPLLLLGRSELLGNLRDIIILAKLKLPDFLRILLQHIFIEFFVGRSLFLGSSCLLH